MYVCICMCVLLIISGGRTNVILPQISLGWGGGGVITQEMRNNIRIILVLKVISPNIQVLSPGLQK